MKESENIQLSFAAIDRFIEKLIESPAEKKGAMWTTWGDKNTYPQYIKGLCRTVPTLRTIRLSMIDYICGNNVTALHGLPGRPDGSFDRKGTNARALVKALGANAVDLGAIPIKVTLNADGRIGELESIPMEYLRIDEDGERFWYNEKWGRSNANIVEYPRFIKGTRVPESIYLVKLWGDLVYPEPVFAASVKACETERSIDSFHLGQIERGFMGSYVVNFCNGAIPTDEEKKQVEKNFTEKFGGHQNAGRIMFSWCRDKDHQTTLQKMEIADYGEKYETLSKHCRQQIFTAFRCNGNLVGVPTESNGFNSEEYESAFKLFNRTMVQPIQQQIIDAIEYVLDEKGIITIEPFTLEGTTVK